MNNQEAIEWLQTLNGESHNKYLRGEQPHLVFETADFTNSDGQERPCWIIKVLFSGMYEHDPRLPKLEIDRSDEDFLHVFENGAYVNICCGNLNFAEAVQFIKSYMKDNNL